jgi:hypothetical protein
MMLDQFLVKIIDAADVDDAEDVAIRRFLVAALRESTRPVLGHDGGLSEAPNALDPLLSALPADAVASRR